jgi:hypothetical protein
MTPARRGAWLSFVLGPTAVVTAIVAPAGLAFVVAIMVVDVVLAAVIGPDRALTGRRGGDGGDPAAGDLP